MKTVWLLLGQYEKTLIPLEDVRKDFFPHLNMEMFKRKLAKGEIKLPIIQVDSSSAKSHRGVHVEDLATFLDEIRQSSQKDLEKMGRGIALRSASSPSQP